MNIYLIAREVIKRHPGIGKEGLGIKIGCAPVSAGRFISRYEGEVHGHGTEPAYQQLLQIIRTRPGWSRHKISEQLALAANISPDRAKRLVARHQGATAPLPPLPTGTDWQQYLKTPHPKRSRDELKELARPIIRLNSNIGIQKLAKQIGCRNDVARLVREEVRGEIAGHSNDTGYQQMLAYIQQQQQLGYPRPGQQTIAENFKITPAKAALWLARWRGATAHITPAQPNTPPAPPTPSASLQPPVPASTAPTPDVALMPINPPDEDGSWDNTDEKIRVVCSRGTSITTADQLLQHENVDLSAWEKIRTNIKRRDDGHTEIQIQLRRLSENHAFQILNRNLLDEYERIGSRKAVVPYVPSDSGMLYLPSLADLHLGKYAWAPEVGADYDMQAAQEVAMLAVEKLLGMAMLYKPEQILFALGNDYFNSDNLEQTTTAGTPQNEIGRWQQSFLLGKGLIVGIIEQCRKVAPVHVLVVTGNHDTQRTWYLGDTIHSYFKQTPGVVVDNSPRLRKYFAWGKTLLGFAHGDSMRHERLPSLMATEEPALWATSTCREWLLGHYHSKRQKFFPTNDEEQGVAVRIMPSLCPSDAWHYRHGYGSNRAAQGFLYHKQAGLVAEFTHSILNRGSQHE